MWVIIHTLLVLGGLARRVFDDSCDAVSMIHVSSTVQNAAAEHADVYCFENEQKIIIVMACAYIRSFSIWF